VGLFASAMTACVVVPVDPRTGQPYPMANVDSNGNPIRNNSGVVVVTPPANPGPPAPSIMTVRLYPLNTQANKGGMLTATVVDNNSGRGTFSLNYLGDALQGESTRVDSSYAAFGRIHTEVLGTAANRTFTGRRGIANAFGGKGVNAQCEYLISGPATGTGVCQFSDGAKYQMHFGS
jgi:hypothetical protein